MYSSLEKSNKMKEGLIYVPYVIKTVTGPSKEYTAFMKSYHKKHAVCPKCGSIKHSTTLMGYILNMDNKEAYKDLNKCVCSDCNFCCTEHERISKKEFEKLKK